MLFKGFTLCAERLAVLGCSLQGRRLRRFVGKVLFDLGRRSRQLSGCQRRARKQKPGPTEFDGAANTSCRVDRQRGASYRKRGNQGWYAGKGIKDALRKIGSLLMASSIFSSCVMFDTTGQG